MDKKPLPARPPYMVGRKYLPMPYINNENAKDKFDWDIDEPIVKVVREYLRYIAHKTFR